MLEIRIKKAAPLLRSTRADAFGLAGPEGRRLRGTDGQVVEVARRTEYYKLTRAPAKVNAELAAPIKEMIEAGPSFGYRTVAALLGMNKSAVQCIFRLKG